MEAGVPVRVKNSYNPQHPGTVIAAEPARASARRTTGQAITSKDDVTLVDVVSTRMLGAHGFPRARLRTRPRGASSRSTSAATSEVSVSLTLDRAHDAVKLARAAGEPARSRASRRVRARARRAAPRWCLSRGPTRARAWGKRGRRARFHALPRADQAAPRHRLVREGRVGLDVRDARGRVRARARRHRGARRPRRARPRAISLVVSAADVTRAVRDSSLLFPPGLGANVAVDPGRFWTLPWSMIHNSEYVHWARQLLRLS